MGNTHALVIYQTLPNAILPIIYQTLPLPYMVSPNILMCIFFRKDLIVSGFTSKVVHVNGDVFKEGAPDRLTAAGFQKDRIPDQLFQRIKEDHDQIIRRNAWVREGKNNKVCDINQK